MKTNSIHPDERELSAMLRETRNAPPLPPGFHDAVWRRIERAETGGGEDFAAPWLERLAGLVLRPRWAVAALSAMLVLGAVAGTLSGRGAADEAAQERYVASVSPPPLRW